VSLTVQNQRRGRRRLVIPRGSLGDAQPPYTAVLSLDRGRHGARHATAIVIAFMMHALMAGAVILQHETVAHVPRPIPHAEMRATLDRGPPPAPAPAPTPEPLRPHRPVAARVPRRSLRTAPPAPAQAGRIIAQSPAPSGPADMTGFDLVVGQGESYAGGYSSAKGTSQHEVIDPGAKVGGVPDAPPAPDLSRSAVPVHRDWACSWPDEAQDSDVRSVLVAIRVNVSADGLSTGVEVLSAPPGGFAEAARHCAEHETYRAALDPSGKPIASATHLFNVHFLR